MNKFVNLSFLWNDINRSTAETKEISQKVLEQLERQEESMMNTNKILTESKELLDKSNKVLNNMSWFGWFTGFIPFKSFFSRIFRRGNREDILFIDSKEFNKDESLEISDEERNKFLPIQYEVTINNRNTNVYDNKENIEILKLEKELNDLLWIGSKIGEHLDLHNHYLDQMNEKTQIIQDKTKKSTKKTTDFL